MSITKLSLRHLIAIGLFASFLSAQRLCYSQGASTAPTGTPSQPIKTQSPQESIDDVPLVFLMDEAKIAFDEKKFSRASLLLQKALVNSESREEAQNVKGLLATTLLMNEEFLDALHVLNDLSKSKTESSLLLMRAGVLFKAGWRSAVLDELRNGLRNDPKSIQLRKLLADALLSSPIATEADSAEALTALMPLKDGIAEDPRIAGAIGMAAAGAGDFDLAVKMQKRYMESLDANQKEREAEKLSRYERKQPSMTLPFPAWDAAKQLSKTELASTAHKSMVMVRVIREMELIETESGTSEGLVTSKQTNFGTVVSSMGSFLVSSNLVRMPKFEEYIHGTAGSVKLISEKIEVLTMPDRSGLSQSLGLARVQGIDEPTGLALLEFTHVEHFEHVKYDELATIQFMPEYRLLDPATKTHLERLYEYSVEKGDKTNVPSLRQVEADLSQYSAFHDRMIAGPTMAKLAAVPRSQNPLGSPVFNQLGECVGITHEISLDSLPRTVIIPAAVCTRIAAKLMSASIVRRASLPVVVGGMLTGVREPLMGMYVMKVTSKNPIYRQLEGTTILAVDGIATPTQTEWLMVLERAYVLGLKSVVLEIYDPKDKITSCMTVPVEL